jgi:hypothetical protein
VTRALLRVDGQTAAVHLARLPDPGEQVVTGRFGAVAVESVDWTEHWSSRVPVVTARRLECLTTSRG